MALGKKAIETLSVNAVRDSIMMTDLLDQYIPDNDKEPFWDGSVYVYSDKSHNKKTFKGRMSVQVKGTENNDFSKDEITYPVKITDLKGYLADGGTIYFVVYVGSDGQKRKIYYIELTPIRIRIFLDSAKNQQSKPITLKAFPSGKDLKTTIFMNCLQHCQKQSSFSYAPLCSLFELQKQGVLEKITIPFSGIGAEKDPQKALVGSDAYVYASIKGSAIPQPLPFIPEDLQTIEENDTRITIGGKVFYEKIRIVKDASSTKYVFGESFTITAVDNKDGVTVNYNTSDKASVICKDLDFLLSLLDAGYFMDNGQRFDFSEAKVDYSKFNIENQGIVLDFCKKVEKVLEALNCKNDLSLKSMQDECYRNLDRLYSALIENKLVKGFKKGLPPICKMKVGNLNFVVIITLQDESDATYMLKDFFSSEILLVCENENGNRYPISQYAVLSADDLLNADNVNWSVLLPSFQKLWEHNETFVRANLFMLELITTYDKSKNKEILNVADAFSDWLMSAAENELPYSIRKLNQLQIIKRRRILNADETKALYEIILNDDTDDIVLTGAYLLLDQQESAQEHFEKLTPEIQDEFMKYPIYHFWKDAGDKNNGQA